MKLKKTFICVFLTAFFIGDAFVPTTKKEIISPISATPLIPLKMPTPPPEIKKEQTITEETVDWKEEDETKFKIKLLETGEGFHGDQVNAKSGEIWLGLFLENNKFFLRSTKLTVRRVKDEIVDGEGEKTGKSIFTSHKNPMVFLLKNAGFLREGEIKTVFYASEIDDFTGLKNGSQKSFKFNGETYNLRVENRTSSDEYLGKGSKLVLSRGGKEQVLNYLKDGCNDCYWHLFWVGDLDKDGKLDFYIDLSWHYNVMDRRLFLSSKAEKGKLVKNVANFWTNGC